MAIAHSKLTAQGQISVPARVRRKLGIGPGSVLEWDEDGDRVIVRKLAVNKGDEVLRLLGKTQAMMALLRRMQPAVHRGAHLAQPGRLWRGGWLQPCRQARRLGGAQGDDG